VKQVIDIIERCAEGTCVSRPFRVRTDDGMLYWIKGCGTGWNRYELCYELLAARMAIDLDLPVAQSEILEVPATLLEFCAVPGIRDLQAGPAFGSQHVDNAVSLPPVAVETVPQTIRQKILLFDWWIQNEDRTLGNLGGNVNLLWNPDGNHLTVIDHNNAFDNDFDESAFFKNHVFRAERLQISASLLLEQTRAFTKTAARFSALTGDFPAEWTERQAMPGDFVPESVIEILARTDKLSTVFGDRQ